MSAHVRDRPHVSKRWRKRSEKSPERKQPEKSQLFIERQQKLGVGCGLCSQK